MNNTEIFNVGITRGEYDASLYIDNTDVFKSQVKNEQKKTSSLDHVKLETIPNRGQNVNIYVNWALSKYLNGWNPQILKVG